MQNFFKRREKKYLITRDQETALQKILTHLNTDQNGEYLVQNLYYDTADWDIIRKSIEKPFYKEKLRLRLYGQNRPGSEVYLELKNKIDGTTYKRRIAIPLNEIKKHGIHEIVSSNNSQISREIDYFLRGNKVSEKIFIAFKRIAFTGADDNLRITFDRDIMFSLCSLNKNNFDYYNPENGINILKPNQLIMEIKTSSAMPLWFAKALSENSIFPVSFSKYGVCFSEYINKNNCQHDYLKEAENAA